MNFKLFLENKNLAWPMFGLLYSPEKENAVPELMTAMGADPNNPWDNKELLNKGSNLIRDAKDLKLIPAEKPGHVRMFHSILNGYDKSDPESIARGIIKGGLQASKGRGYKHVMGYEFGGIWITTIKPHNTNVVWVAFDVPETKITPMALKDMQSNRQQVDTLGFDIPPEWIVAVNGLPVEWLR